MLLGLALLQVPTAVRDLNFESPLYGVHYFPSGSKKRRVQNADRAILACDGDRGAMAPQRRDQLRHLSVEG